MVYTYIFSGERHFGLVCFTCCWKVYENNLKDWKKYHQGDILEESLTATCHFIRKLNHNADDLIEIILFKNAITASYELELDVIKINHFSKKQKFHYIHYEERYMAKDLKTMNLRRNNFRDREGVYMHIFTLDYSVQRDFSYIMFSNNLQKNICIEEQAMVQQNYHLENCQNSDIFFLSTAS